MLDIALFREEKGGNPDLIRESQRRRFESVELVDEVIAKDKEWRDARGELDDCNAQMNKLGKEISKIMRETKGNKEAVASQLEQKANIEKRIAELKENVVTIKNELDSKLHTVGNLIDETVPCFEDEEHNRVERTFGECTPLGEGRPHHELLWMIDGYEPERGVAIAGARQYFLKGMGVLLQMALVNYGTNFLAARGYTPLQVPFMMRKDIMAETAELAQFDEELYKVSGDGDDKYLIATSEQPISAYHRGEWMAPKSLPLKYAGHSTCFRKEAGSSGRETWGIFRVHQFDKIEQFIICDPESSHDHHEEMCKLSEEFLQSLEIPYQVISIVSGALNKAAAKKYDIEAWFPGYGQYKEVVSCSNCTDYQARRMQIRYGESKVTGQAQQYVHMLNGTLCATTRTICAILENHQTPDGIRIPEVLKPYMHLPNGEDMIPFTRDLPKPKVASKKKKGKK
mmetsp:Transcript_12011/g.18934  ORF Transcript_12011/g.18934 Transcript_12011/m.18934 type:complete len:456 (-) Transcript_12011:28-1395(-)|eukprot:CAMPEP_0117042564 /NCGR_PEP_ID=MMETSP0472-20121206/29633_1 /TAXON_ID=693140 ORGANISM="Tiarina fusus, Strain LIS" /NCGR_SAMPLE_ID=MMETSP0472 /ASSEMBLY_ACC=CAM_ASM_000603 /LENGTH=455 /DNA_ID=CAMNT_0004753837 /DNA_START=31 /DNA_END=1398 /DNA_ORIENTATION=+